MNHKQLAIHGGPKVRSTPLPARRLFGEEELRAVTRVFAESWENGVDFGFQGRFEAEFTEQFCRFQGGGFADAVNSGTSAVYIALQALALPAGSEVIVSPVTNPGGVMPVAIQDVRLLIADADPNRFNISPEAFARAITPETRAAVLTHLGGHAIDLDPILEIARRHEIKIIEDCSQAHGTLYKGKRVGTFGAIAAFSTMYSKTLATGGTGGLVYTPNEEYYWRIRSLADRGKPFQRPGFDFKNTTDYLFPALNFNADELSCAIGSSVLARLQEIIDRRHDVAGQIDKGLGATQAVRPAGLELPGTRSSMFFHTVLLDLDRLKVSKKEFVDALAAEGIWLNGDYRDITCEWRWIPEYVRNFRQTPNAINFRDKSFNILFNERFTGSEVEDIIAAILKVEAAYC
ncbi:MAG: glutamine--scyllo-inositol aminotransferase [Desulfobulbaceae bacterium]|nr:glutamine--scyllo-inositol aminotransferase [Desulfobulbaceae bacterium]